MIRKKTYIGYADTVYGDGFSTTDKNKPYIGTYEGIDIDYLLQTGGENLVINSGEDVLLSGYVLATDDDFSGTTDGNFKYIGDEPYITIPHEIKGVPITSYVNMFADSSVIKGIASNNPNVTNMSVMFFESPATELDLSNLDTSSVTDMSWMFMGSQATEIDLSNFDTSNVTTMTYMFYVCQATEIDLSNFDTSSVTDMSYMFSDGQATELNLSSFDTSSVTNMSRMFQWCPATELDLSSFDTSNVTDMSDMFENSEATTGYARTQADADRFNATSNKPAGLTFIVKP